MILRPCQGFTPTIASTARLAENATVVGDVTLGENVTVWYGAVLRGDVGPIRIGDGTNIQDNCVLHCATGQPTILGRDVVVGHGAILHSCVIGDGCLIGMGAILLDGCTIGEGSIIGAGTLVPPGKAIAPGSVVMGVPGQVVRQVRDGEAVSTLENAAHYVALGLEQLKEPQ